MPRRLLTRAPAVAPLVAVLVLAAAVTGSGQTATAATAHCSTKLDGPGGRLAAFAHRHHAITLDVAVRDLRDGATYGYRRRARERTASIVKVEILEALLHAHRHGLSQAQSATATGMIEHSDNADAQRLYDAVGSAAGLRRFGRLAGLRDTSPAAASGPGYAWGLTLTSPDDQLRLLGLLTHRNAVLTGHARSFALHLMHHVEADQRWGVSSGVGGGQIALKNGWLPLHDWTSDWQINSIGAVHDRTRNYLIAIESHGAATMRQGVELVDDVSRIVARACG